MKVCFFIWALRAAGAERVLSTLANAWAEKGWEVVVVTMEEGQAKPFYPLAEAIQLRPLGLLKDSTSPLSALSNNLRRVRILRRTFREIQPDVVVSFIDKANALAVLSTRGLGIPVVISERTDPSRRSLGRVWGTLRDLAYPRADRVVFQSKGVLDWFPPKVRARGLVIPNPVPAPPAAKPGLDAPRPSRLIALGRLSPVKGFDVLIRAFAKVAAQAPDWSLDIFGEGPERQALERQVQEAGLAGRIRFPGLTEQPFDELRRSEVFVMPSRVEGFPNALVEAMACGLPVVSTDFGGAARDILRDGQDGLLVPTEDAEALAAALLRLMQDPAERSRLGRAAAAVVSRFSPERVIALWEAAVLGAAGKA